EYPIGLILAGVVAGTATIIGFYRERSFYPTMLIVIASYYVLFATMGAFSVRTLVIEIFVAGGFLLCAVLGFKRNLWFVVVALIGHGAFDLAHDLGVDNPGVPQWWPGFCLAFDVAIGGWLGMQLLTRQSDRFA
ncbi:MAG: hypothetical protein M3R15_11230, partial [Acidobacteriota bacterium]|nr:hypothetical protein [Acidobacteriota bacterium]